MTLIRNAPPKPPPGEFFLERKARGLKADAHEQTEMRAAKKRDGYTCRRPKCPYCPRKPRLESCHLKELHRGLGGNPLGDRTTRRDLVTLDFISHREYDRGDLVIKRVTRKGFDGLCKFYERDAHGTLHYLGSSAPVGKD